MAHGPARHYGRFCVHHRGRTRSHHLHRCDSVCGDCAVAAAEFCDRDRGTGGLGQCHSPRHPIRSRAADPFKCSGYQIRSHSDDCCHCSGNVQSGKLAANLCLQKQRRRASFVSQLLFGDSAHPLPRWVIGHSGNAFRLQ